MPPTRRLRAGASVGRTLTSSFVTCTVCTGRHASRAAASAVSTAGPGGRPGRNSALAGTSRPSGTRSSSTVSSSAPEAPSMAEWWILV
jgi:hypothetical protein